MRIHHLNSAQQAERERARTRDYRDDERDMRRNFDYSGYDTPQRDPLRDAREALESRQPYRRFVRDADVRGERAQPGRVPPGFDEWERERFVPRGRFEQNPWDAPRGDRPYARDLRDEQFAGESQRSHTGRGPRGYVRPDARIHEDICDRLYLDHELDARDIEVLVANGRVTLEGRVDSPRSRRRADDLAHAVPGVTDVHNHLQIGDGRR